MTNSHWIEKDLHSQKTLNQIRKNSDSNSFNCWLYFENDQYFITDLLTKLIAKIGQKPLKKFKRQSTISSITSCKFTQVYLKQFLYSSMTNFKSSKKETYIFVFIDDFDLKSTTSDINLFKKIDPNSITFGYHPLFNKQQDSKKNPLPNKSSLKSPHAKNEPSELNKNQINPDEPESNLSQMVNNLSDLSALENYTINLIEKTSPIKQSNQMCTKNKDSVQQSDLNQAFTKNSLSQSITDAFKLDSIKNNSISIEDTLSYRNHLRDSNTQTNFKQSSQLNECPIFEGSCISNGSLIMSYTPSLLTCSTQMSNINGLKTNEHVSLNKKSISPLTESERITRSGSKSSIKITPININTKKISHASKDTCSPSKNVDTLISSDESNEVSEDNDESIGSKKHKKIIRNEINHFNNLENLPISPVKSIGKTLSNFVETNHSLTIPNTSQEKYDKETNKNGDNLTSAEKPSINISTEENSNNNNKDLIQFKESTILISNSLPHKNLLQLNPGNLCTRRGSNYSNSSYSTESSSVNGTHLSPDYTLNSPRKALMKRKRKLMEKNNKACDQFSQGINKHEEKQLTKPMSSHKLFDTSEEDEDSDEQIKIYAKNKFSQIKTKDNVLDTSFGCSSMLSKSASSSSTSLSSETSLTDVCSKSLIFAPKELYKYKEKLFKKSLSEKKTKEKSERKLENVHSIFSPRFSTTSKTQSCTYSKIVISETIANSNCKSKELDSSGIKKSHLNPSKVLDEIIDNQTKLNGNQINLNQSKNSENTNHRRRRLFNPITHNYDQSFDVILGNGENSHNNEPNIQLKANQKMLSETNNSVLSSNDLSKRTVSINSVSNQTIPMGQKPPNDITTDKSGISSNETFNLDQNNMLNCNFKLNPDTLQSYLAENKALIGL